MRYYIENYERATAKNGNDFLKVSCTSENKEKFSLFLWDNLESFVHLFDELGCCVMDMEITADPSFPKIVSFSQSAGDVTEFYSFVYSSDEQAEQVFNALYNYITDPLLHDVCERLFLLHGPADYETIKDYFILVPAAKAYHHDYRYGTLQHTHQVMTFINRIAEAEMFASSIDRQLALCAGLLHDVGKCFEYSFNGVSAVYGTDSEINQIYLASHLYKGAELVAVAYAQLKMENPDRFTKLDDARIEHLKHCILAHHLQREWAAVPKQPQTLEAYLVFLADYFSAQFGKVQAIDWSNCSLDNLFGATSKSDTFFGFTMLGD